jgi:hypothetical protein
MGTGRQVDKDAAMDAAQVATDGGWSAIEFPMARPRWTFILLGVNVSRSFWP